MSAGTIQSSYPLSPLQQGMLFHYLSAEHAGVDLEQIVCTLREPLNVSALRAAWQRTVERHGVLRTRFEWEGRDEPIQCVHAQAEVPWRELDWSDLEPARHRAELESLLREDRQRGFRLDTAPLLRLTLVRLSNEHYELVWSFPHIILDGRSFPIVLGDAFSLYDEERGVEPAELPKAKAYADFIRWLGWRDASGDEAFWRAELSGFRVPTPLGATRRAPVTEKQIADHAECSIALGEAETASLERFARAHDVGLNTLVQGAWALLLGRYSDGREVVFGAARHGRGSTVEGAEEMVGLFINTLPVRVSLPTDQPVLDWLLDLRASQRRVARHEHAPLVEIQAWSEVHGTSLFESIIVFDGYLLNSRMQRLGGAWSAREFWLHEQTNYPLALYGYGEKELRLKLAFDRRRFDAGEIECRLGQLRAALLAFAAHPDRPLGEVEMLGSDERQRVLHEWNATEADYPRESCVHELFEAQVDRTPDATALVFEGEELSYRELDARANRLAHRLLELGVGPDVLVGVCLERSTDMLVAILAVLKAGGAYVPLDADYPRQRNAFMLEDASVRVLVTSSALRRGLPAVPQVVYLDTDASALAARSSERPASGVGAAHLAYVIYTSGSTGRPKGVMVEHRNVVNFFTGMDACVRHDPPGVWLAVTSLSFDISVLELFWTLARGFAVVLYADEKRAAARAEQPLPNASKPLAFSLFYFASDGPESGNKYRLLLEGAKFADRRGFSAVWTPERHFHAFGGIYPNPSVTGAAVAAVTENLSIRAGSVVLPLHDPIRVAEEWSVVDNLSGGRAGLSVASGWQPNDFVLRPENYTEAKKVMFRQLDTVRRLWRGEAIELPGPNGELVEVRTLPRPVQPELPVWITTAGNPETFRLAGEVGASVLTHLLGQTIDEVAENIRAYRKAWRDHGHPPDRGQVTLMLHTFVGDDTDVVRETVREPMKAYLRSALSLVRGFSREWTAFKKRADGSTDVELDLDSLSDDEMEGLLDYSFERYFETSALFGTPERCLEMVDRLKGIGVDEVASLIDFGVDTDQALAHLEHLDRVRERAAPQAEKAESATDWSLPAQVQSRGVTHLQCTPSMASMLVLDEDAGGALGSLQTILIGGEALPPTLARKLRELGPAEILNMYGPTETTVWSSTQPVVGDEESIAIGRPIANTRLYVLDERLRPCPIGVPGELWIGGEGVVRGYLHRPELTAERFVPDPFRPNGARMYRTGDVARHLADGRVEFLGRADQQIKLRGHRIELGEIEARLNERSEVREALVIAREDAPGDHRLVAYLIPSQGGAPDEAVLRAALRESMPEYMVPAHFVLLDAYPLTPNRKIDRRALPAPSEADPDTTPLAHEPAGEIEERIAATWKEILGVSRVGTRDNFFDLGGHSLLAVKVHRRLKSLFERELRITDLFRFPTVGALAEYLSRAEDPSSLERSQARAETRRSHMARRREEAARRRDRPSGPPR